MTSWRASTEPLRILHLLATSRWTGVAEPAVSTAQLQQARGHTVWVAGIWGRSFEQVVEARRVPRATGFELRYDYRPWVQLETIRGLCEFIKREQVDVVHCHLIHDHWIAALALRRLGPTRPLLVRTVHRYESMRRDPAHAWLFQRATDLIITVSQEQKRIIENAYPRLCDEVEVIYGGVNPNRFRPDLPGAALVRADMGEPPDARVAGLVAHLGYNRGHRWLLRVAPRVVATVPNSTIWIVGQGELKSFLRHELRKPQYRGRVLLTGYRTDDLPETYAAMDVGLLLGIGSEGSARAALEAMATARPVIAVRKGALVDTISHGADGLLVPEDDDAALESALIRLLGNPEEARRMGEAARRKVLERFTEDIRAERTLEAYRRALERRTARV
ncbi:MAG: hypothetical protein KatS3mg130_1501 [Candidatus Sumerlaea sp.]|nr:MAG: hypothetical protein KatS3mg130_1501 [Candidatus Sumerlaea sp.]